MKKKLKCILLIDDDEPTNFLNKLILKEMNCAEKIEVAQSGPEAIKFLNTIWSNKEYKDQVIPDIVFLDINMPAMDGWEFVNALETFNSDRKNKHITIMLTTSLNPDDEKKSRTVKQINEYRRKPLSREMMEEILDEYFSSLPPGAPES